MKIKYKDLKKICEAILIKSGMSAGDSGITADVLATTDAFGVHSHGCRNLAKYLEKVKRGGIDIAAIPEVIAEGAAWAMMDAHNSMGMVSSYKAMNIAMSKAKAAGIGYVGVKNGSHFGAAGYYSNMAAKADMIGIAMSNTDPNMSVPGGKGMIIGNNPFSYAAPAGNGSSIFLDIAMSTVAFLKVAKAKEDGTPVPAGWLVDADGLPTTDTSQFPTGAFLQPMGGHKGYGLALMVEVLAAVMTGAGTGSENISWNRHLANKNNLGHAFMAFDIQAFIPVQDYKRRINGLIDELRASPKAADSAGVILPGQTEWDKYNKMITDGMDIPDDIYESLKSLAASHRIDIGAITKGCCI